ncbi:peptide chain release factor N(5)-glutamine methyltransferase [Helcobacillus massiliensis]|uniref:N5-glutamine methyltransferase family protein n=1 Tax=Helcobacillus massiliensis TaxID=521392 RepID=UPI0021A8AEB7|nr:HemK/PrmC family methyltransferase [Helcobacillus massiliensis]MCT1557360.1 peptide chain release factor N(5)-glutamine methyltransferase [Helcobacillus massiliensis]MCT2037096.1 peptide chain release factor N(5)-glutamine methyltransferase [Helcobacillus massiliensis]MCT2331645.1 peptide chain release factor N(5)-glutamine methyltransferase [Helcobacillus massiliensis]
MAEVRLRVGAAIRATRARLEAAGIESADAEARALVSHAAGSERSLVLLDDLPVGFDAELERLTTRRCTRAPLQLVLGRAPFRRLSLEMRTGVFIPRPETELIIDLVLAFRGDGERVERAVDLCTGSGALAASLVDELPRTSVWGIDISEDAVGLARANVAAAARANTPAAAGATVPAAARAAAASGGGGADGSRQWHIRRGSVTDPQLLETGGALGDVGTADVVVSNPPYIPPGAVPRDPEVVEHDPHAALFGGGEDGLEIPRAVAQAASALLRGGGLFVMEHADVQGESARRMLEEVGGFTSIRTVSDLTGRDRFLTARRAEK